MHKWIKFFLGTPKRFLTTLSVIAALAIVEAVAPGTIETSIRPITDAILVYAMMFLILGFGFKLILSSFAPKKTKKS